MFCGESGTAKTVTVKSAFSSLDSEKFMFLNINFSSRTSSLDFQNIIEENIDKRTFKNYGPKASGKKMIIFIDDMNMPKRDPYDTQNAISLLRQHKDYEHWYDKSKLSLKDITNTQLVAAMNPTAGSFVVENRL